MTVNVSSNRVMTRALVVLVAVLAASGAVLAARSVSSGDPAGDPPGRAAGAVESARAGTGAPESTPGAEPAPGAKPSPASLTPVPVEPVRTLPAVAMSEPADFGTGLQLVVTGAESVAGTARGPGEIAGPAVQLSLELRNHSDEPIGLDHVVVSLEHGPARAPASPLAGPPARDFEGVLEPSSTQRATYVYAVPTADHDDLRILASYAGEAPAVALVGAVR